ncbi:MAG: sugar phosphate isomerase/epimerase [Planctomycetes bacterium]|nr:sugar phosphate isomerase/epimerase [Planctomycetota bacterium]
MMNRRTFLHSTTVLPVALASFSSRALSQEKADKIALSTWSFHNYFPNTRYGKPEFELAEWNLEKVMEIAQSKIGISNFELSSAHLASLENDYLLSLKKLAKDKGYNYIHLSDNMKGVNLARADETKRAEDFKRFVELISVAEKLGIPSMRVNTGTPEKSDWDLATTIGQYKKLAALGKDKGVEIVIENHFGISADPVKVAKIIEEVGINISSCPDFGLFKSEPERTAGLPIMFKHARKVCSAKFHGFDEQGKPKDFDLENCYKVLKSSNYKGWVSLEYEGPKEPTEMLMKMKPLAQQWLA